MSLLHTFQGSVCQAGIINLTLHVDKCHSNLFMVADHAVLNFHSSFDQYTPRPICVDSAVGKWSLLTPDQWGIWTILCHIFPYTHVFSLGSKHLGNYWRDFSRQQTKHPWLCFRSCIYCTPLRIWKLLVPSGSIVFKLFFMCCLWKWRHGKFLVALPASKTRL